MTIGGVNGFNVRTLGVSRDQVMAAQQKVRGAYTLCMDDPELVRAVNAFGTRSIYRQSGDGNLGQDPAEFVRTRAEKGAHFLHLTNEIGSSPELHQWTRTALETATALGVKTVCYNFATHTPLDQWQAALPNLEYAVKHGHAVGFHCYLDGVHDDTAFAWDVIRRQVGGTWIATEFGYIRDYRDANKGWRGWLEADKRTAFITKWMRFFQQRNIGLCYFSFDYWNQPDPQEAKNSGFGYWDYPDVLNNFAVFNDSLPIKEQAVTVIPHTQPPTAGGVLAALTAIPQTFVNVRQEPTTDAPVSGNLLVGDTVTYYANAAPGWAYVQPVTSIPRPSERLRAAAGWVALQSNAVRFTPTGDPPAANKAYSAQQVADMLAHLHAVEDILSHPIT